MTENRDPEKIVREIKRKTCRKFSTEEKIRILLEGLRGELSLNSVAVKASAPTSITTGPKSSLKQASAG